MMKRYEHILSYDPGNVQGIGGRDYQEDSFGFVNAGDVKLIGQQGLFAAVADGIGGLKDGKEASTITIDTLRADFMKYDRNSHLGTQLARSILKANEIVYHSYQKESGSTVVAAILYKEMLYFASVGDSTIWLVRKNERDKKGSREVIRLNEPHNMRFRKYMESITRGSADPFEARNDPQEHSLTEYIGKESIQAIDLNFKPLLLRNGDVIILCSDGVGDVLSEKEVLYCLQEGLNSQQVCALIDSLIRNKKCPGQDNYTAIVIRCII